MPYPAQAFSFRAPYKVSDSVPAAYFLSFVSHENSLAFMDYVAVIVAVRYYLIVIHYLNVILAARLVVFQYSGTSLNSGWSFKNLALSKLRLTLALV